MLSPHRPVGDLLRDWRQRRRRSQLDLALEAEISQKHLSFVESGRSKPSREMILHLAERLDVPLRARNALLLAAGFAPLFPERRLDDPALSAARAAVEMVLKGHEPYPALAIDRHWTLVAANQAVAPLLAGVVDQSLLQPPANILRLSLHSRGLLPRIENAAEWRTHILERLRAQVDHTADAVLTALLAELRAYPAPENSASPDGARDYAGVVLPLRLRMEDGRVLSFFSTTTVFGTPVDITLSEIALETFFPADAETASALRTMR